MKYRPTPLNIVCLLAVIVAIYSAIKSGSEGWGILITIYLIPVIIISLLADLILQKFLTKYLFIFVIELLLLSVIYFSYSWTQRTKTLIIPDKLQSEFVVTLYGVENSPKLPNGWNYEIKVPTNGVLMTSSTLDSDLPDTKIKTYSGANLNSDETDLGWVRIEHGEFDCKGKTYEYQLWMVNSFCCTYSNQDIENFRINLQEQFCEQ